MDIFRLAVDRGAVFRPDIQDRNGSRVEWFVLCRSNLIPFTSGQENQRRSQGKAYLHFKNMSGYLPMKYTGVQLQAWQ